MALTPTQEAQVLALVAQEAALLSLAAEEPAIISNLGATDVSLSDLSSASSLADADLLLVRQGGTDKSISGAIVKAASTVTVMESIDYTLAGNALTLKLNPTTLAFRSTTLTSGAPTLVSNAAQITTTISSGSTGGTISGVQSEIVILAINNAGTMQLAWTNLAGGVNLDETTLINTTAEGGAGAADSATVIYSTTARTGVAFRVVGIFRSTQTTAGTWAQTPTLVQPIGGQALAAMQSLGYGQTWQNMTGSRALNTNYTNTTGKPIAVSVYWSTPGAIQGIATVAGAVADNASNNGAGLFGTNRFTVPPGATYSLAVSTGTIGQWLELR